MNNESAYSEELLKMVWLFQAGNDFDSPNAGAVSVRATGEYDPALDMYTGVEAIIDGVVYHGDALFDGEASRRTGSCENCIIHVVAAGSPFILKHSGEPLVQVILDPGAVTTTVYSMLREDAENYGCAAHIRAMPSHERVAMFTRLLSDRLHRKCNDLKVIYEECDQNWNETMYVMLLRTMGDAKNKEAFTELARRVKYIYLSRERNTLRYIESMLLGTSGLLELYDDDSYIRDLKADYEYLRKKYSLTSMMPREWTISNTNPNNHPVIRIAQLAAFLSTREFLFENLVRCKTVEELHMLFRAEASSYWSTHYIPSKRTYERPKRIGHFKANILGINLAIPMIFSYGDYMGEDELKDVALELLEKINCEDNRIINGWRSGGVVMESAFDSQAMLQLNNEYCLRGLCSRCSVGKRVICEVYRNEHF